MLEAKISTADLLSALGERYATKKFDQSKKIPADTWRALEESLRLAPSSFGLQPWKFIVVDNPAVRAELQPASWGQSQVVDADKLVVFATLKQVDNAHVRHYIEDMAQTRGIPPEALAGYEQMMQGAMAGKNDHLDWTRRQSYIAMGFLGLSAALLGVDTCMLEGIDPAAYDKILGLEGTEWASVAIVTAGYRSPEDDSTPAQRAKSRFPLDEVIKHI
jgi:nitroreductase